MPILRVYVSDDTLALLENFSKADAHGRSVEQLAEDAVEEAAVASHGHQPASQPTLPLG